MTPVRPVVEVAFGYTLADIVAGGGEWTEITEAAQLGSTGIAITRGAEDEKAQPQPGTLRLGLDNDEGGFTPGYTGSQYYPSVVKNVPIRVRVITTAKNLLTNTSFETGVSPWTASNVSQLSIAQSATRAQHGASSLLITWTGAGSGSVRSAVVQGLDAGQAYTFSAYVWVPTGSTHLALSSDVAGPVGSPSTLFDQWQRITATFTATATSHQVRINSSTSPGAGNQAWVDSVQLEDGTTATVFDSDPAQVHDRFFGVVNDWSVRWAGLLSTSDLTATDVFKPLSRADELRPMAEEEVLRWSPHAYYPADEAAGATSAGDISGNVGPRPLAIVQAGAGGTLTFGETPVPLGISGVPDLAPASASAGKYLRASTGSDFQTASSNEAVLVECWFSTSTQGRNILSVASADNGYYLTFYLAAGTGFLRIESSDLAGTSMTSTPGATNLADGTLHHLVWDEGNLQLWVDGISLGAGLSVAVMRDLATLTIGASPTGATLWNGTVSHVALYADSSIPGSELALHYTTGTTGHSGETADDRAFRLTEYARVGLETQGTFTLGVAQQAELGRTALDHLRELETTESGKLFGSRAGPDVVLQSRTVRYNPVAAWSVEYADLETGDVELPYDDQKLVNVIEVSRPDGAVQRMVNTASRTANGPYKASVQVLRTSDTEVTDLGYWTLYRYADPLPELRQVPVEASAMTLATYRALLDSDISTPGTVTGLPAQAPTATMTVTVEGYTEAITQGQHHLDFHTSRTVTDAVWVLDDATYSVLGSTTRLGY